MRPNVVMPVVYENGTEHFWFQRLTPLYSSRHNRLSEAVVSWSFNIEK